MHQKDAIDMAAWHEERARQARAWNFTSTAETHEQDAEFFRQQALEPTVSEGLSGLQVILLGCICWLVIAGVVALGAFIVLSAQ